MSANAAAPDASRTAVKPTGSASPPRNANRHNIELNAKATSANAVYVVVLIKVAQTPLNAFILLLNVFILLLNVFILLLNVFILLLKAFILLLKAFILLLNVFILLLKAFIFLLNVFIVLLNALNGRISRAND